MTDPYQDPYDVDFYSTPMKKTDSKRAANIFNPSNPPQPTNVDKDNDLPNYVDLSKNAYASNGNAQDGDDEIPILEGIAIYNLELGVNPQHIKEKFISVLTFHKIDKRVLEDSDMTGPLVLFILFAISLVLVYRFINT
jgi:hypothetical protein